MNNNGPFNKRILFYLPYDFGKLGSGSKVRPYKMYHAFQELGYDVTLISGTKDSRLARYRAIPFSEKNGYMFCYCELPTYPLHQLVDYKILLDIWRRDIPIGIYYRDAYWKFEDYFKYKGLKRRELLLRYHLDLSFLSRIASKVFFPSASLARFFKLRVPKIILPPGADQKLVEDRNPFPLKAVYVGGVSERYGTDLMLKAIKSVNKEKVRVTLNLVCRKDELEGLQQQTKELLHVPWVKVHHVSGDKLDSIYTKVNVGLIPLIKDSYNDCTLPIKLFEYLSFGLPTVATACEEILNFIESNGCGIICNDDVQSLSEAIIYLVEHPESLQILSKGAIDVIANGNLWTDRAKSVISSLSTR